MPRFISFRFLLGLIVIAANVAALPAKTAAFVRQREKSAQARQSDFPARLARMERMLEDKRQELGVPGVSLVIVKDDKIIYTKGFGVRDAEKNLPVTPATLFPIGSSTKAFTAMLAAMSVDDGKIAFADSPKKYLSYFKLQDSEADEKITVRDLLRHNSGLGRTEIVWYPGVLNRREVISAVAEAKPTAPFGERYQYQNVMVSAAGEAVARAQNSTWERLMNERILKPLGMKQTTLTLPAMRRSGDYALGYEYNEAAKRAERMPFRSENALASVAPAGAVYSNANEMGQWLRLMLAGGVFDGKRLVSEKNFGELVSPQMKNINGSGVDYGLGWYLANRKGRKIVQHGGSIDGFRVQVSMMPEEKLGFAILTNSYKTPLIVSDLGGGAAEEIIWSNLVDESRINNNTADSNLTNAAPAENAPREVGKYTVANLTVEVTMKDGKLVLNVPGQPPYELANIGGRRYKFASGAPAADGYFVTFRPAADGSGKSEMFLEQAPPKRNGVLTKVDSAADKPKTTADGGDERYKDLLGTYEAEADGKKTVFQLVAQQGKLIVQRPGQRALTLVEKDKDTFSIAGAPDAYEINVKRNEAGKASSLSVKEPKGIVELRRVEEFKSPLSIEELMTQIVTALGGEANLRKHKTLVMTYDINLVNQGVVGTGTISQKAPNLKANQMTLNALGKRLGTIREYFDGAKGGTQSSFLPDETPTEKELAQERIASDFYAPLNWRELYKTIEIKGVTKVGDEEAFIVVKTPNAGTPITDYISTKNYLLLRRDTSRGITRYDDYRTVDGAMMPFKWTIESSGTGEQIIRVKTLKFDVPISDALFRGAAKKN